MSPRPFAFGNQRCCTCRSCRCCCGRRSWPPWLWGLVVPKQLPLDVVVVTNLREPGHEIFMDNLFCRYCERVQRPGQNCPTLQFLVGPAWARFLPLWICVLRCIPKRPKLMHKILHSPPFRGLCNVACNGLSCSSKPPSECEHGAQTRGPLPLGGPTRLSGAGLQLQEA